MAALDMIVAFSGGSARLWSVALLRGRAS